jgi:hypothetical protein
MYRKITKLVFATLTVAGACALASSNTRALAAAKSDAASQIAHTMSEAAPSSRQIAAANMDATAAASVRSQVAAITANFAAASKSAIE